jgi:hypothetical protein
MEKSGFAITATALAVLKVLPWVLAATPLATHGLNRLSGYDPSKKVDKAKTDVGRNMLARYMDVISPTRTNPLVASAQGLHASKARS